MLCGKPPFWGKLQRAAAEDEAGDLPHVRQHLAADLAAREGPVGRS